MDLAGPEIGYHQDMLETMWKYLEHRKFWNDYAQNKAAKQRKGRR